MLLYVARESYETNGVTIRLLIGLLALRVGEVQEMWKGEVQLRNNNIACNIAKHYGTLTKGVLDTVHRYTHTHTHPRLNDNK